MKHERHDPLWAIATLSWQLAAHRVRYPFPAQTVCEAVVAAEGIQPVEPIDLVVASRAAARPSV